MLMTLRYSWQIVSFISISFTLFKTFLPLILLFLTLMLLLIYLCVCIYIFIFIFMHAKSFQLCQTLCDPTGLQPTRLLCPWVYPSKNSLLSELSAMQETWVRSLGQEDALEEDMATYSSILVWRIPWTKDPGGLQSLGSQRAGHE